MNISFMEIAVIFGLALLLFGPEQLPHIARQVGKLVGELRRGSSMIRKEWYNAVYPPAQEMKQEISRYSSELRTIGNEALSLSPTASEAKDSTANSEASITSKGGKEHNQ